MPHNEDANNQWSVYEANVQCYRSNFFSSQSFLIASGAITLSQDSPWLLYVVAAIALYQMWYIWYRVILIRIRIVDYWKYNLKRSYDSHGNKTQIEPCPEDCLGETAYATNSEIRNKVNKNIGEERGIKFENRRLTRRKLDIHIPVSFTLVWIAFLLSKLVD